MCSRAIGRYVDTPASELSGADPEKRNTSACGSPPRSVLVVDDDADIRDALSILLEDEGYTVATARDGRDALEIADSIHPDVVLLDLMMPVMSGWQVLTAMKRSQALRTIPVVVMTAFSNAPSDVPSHMKPFNTDDLLAKLHTSVATDPASDRCV